MPTARPYAIIEAPSILGLTPSGVQDLPERLLELGLAERLQARSAAMLSDSWKAPMFAAPSPKLATDTHLLPSRLAAQPSPVAIGIDDPTTPVVTITPLAA